MNSSKSRFNTTKCKKSYKMEENNEYNGSFTNINKSLNNSYATTTTANGATLKGKIYNLTGEMSTLIDDVNNYKNDVTSMQNENDTLQNILNMKTQEVKNNLLELLNKVESDMNKHFEHQENENKRLMQTIETLKEERTQLQNKLIYMQERMQDLESKVGHDETKKGK